MEEYLYGKDAIHCQFMHAIKSVMYPAYDTIYLHFTGSQ